MEIIPTDAEAALIDTVRDAADRNEPLLVQGNGTKEGMLRRVQAVRGISAVADFGIVLYSPGELVISARAGTPLREIEAALAAGNQHLIAEPPDLSRLLGSNDQPQTLGGVVATNLSGPRRVAWGATRDHVLGIRAVTGHGEVIHSGGRVLKNVTGLDLCKLFTGSHGTLGVITEVTLKVLPVPEQTGSVVVPVSDPAQAVALLSAALGSPFQVSGAAWLPREAASLVPELASFDDGVALMRIENFAASVTYRAGKLVEQFDRTGTSVLDDAASRSVWRAVGNVDPLPVNAGDAVWRVSVRPSAGPGVLTALPGLRGILDWGGGLVWLTGAATEENHVAVTRAVGAVGGVWWLMRAPEALRNAVDVVPPEAPALAAITRRVKHALDPKGVLNPGRLYAGL